MTAAFDPLRLPGNPDDFRRAAILTGIRGTLAAAGSTVTDAAAVGSINKVTKVTGADGAKGVKLFAYTTTGSHTAIVENASASALKVYAPAGGTINGGSVDAAFTVAANSVGVFITDGAVSGGLEVWAFTAGTVSGVNSRLTVAAIAAAGTNAATGTALIEGFNVVSGADDTKGVTLLTAVAGMVVHVKSTVSNKILKIYPATGAAINALGTDTVLSLASGPTPVILVAQTSTLWFSFPLLPS